MTFTTTRQQLQLKVTKKRDFIFFQLQQEDNRCLFLLQTRTFIMIIVQLKIPSFLLMTRKYLGWFNISRKCNFIFSIYNFTTIQICLKKFTNFTAFANFLSVCFRCFDFYTRNVKCEMIQNVKKILNFDQLLLSTNCVLT